MFSVLENRTYRHLFLAQVVALLGTGLATVALGFLAFDLSGGNAGEILGTALAIKMVAYILVAPIASAVAINFPRTKLLVTLDLIRAVVALALPFVTQAWQVYVLIFVLQSASAAFTPIFQATIPDILPEEKDYIKALSLSRLAYDLESVASPMIAAALITVVSFHGIFVGTTIGFIASAALIVSVILPKNLPLIQRSIYERTTRGIRIYLLTPRLRGLLALNLVAAFASAMVIINTVVLVQGQFRLSQTFTAIAFAVYGAGSMLSAVLIPRLLINKTDRSVMLTGAWMMSLCLPFGAFADQYNLMLPMWFVLGVGYSLMQTPSGRLLRRSSHDEDRPSLFAAQFALSHSCWLIAYPMAGWLGSGAGLPMTFITMGVLAGVATLASILFWPRQDLEVIPHQHTELASDDPHMQLVNASGVHEHLYFIDDIHSEWPKEIQKF